MSAGTAVEKDPPDTAIERVPVAPSVPCLSSFKIACLAPLKVPPEMRRF